MKTRSCFWCGGRLVAKDPKKCLHLSCENCGSPPYTCEEATAWKHGRKPAEPLNRLTKEVVQHGKEKGF